jgi:hypothetical protein
MISISMRIVKTGGGYMQDLRGGAIGEEMASCAVLSN